MNEKTPLILVPPTRRALNDEDDEERYASLEDDDIVVATNSCHSLKNVALLTLLCGGVIVISTLQDVTFDYSSAAINCLLHSRPYEWLSPLPRLGRMHYSSSLHTKTTVAFLGNSMLYFNDFPRFFEEISSSSVIQNSCLHGSASIATLLDGNGMYPKFKTHNAVLGKDKYGQYIHDYGACTVSQLLLGQDVQLNYTNNGRQQLTNNNKNVNPCNADISYREYNTYIINQQQSRSMMTNNVAASWDYVVINDNTLHPARHETRYQSLRALQQYYIPWLLETKSIPVFIWTYAYSRADKSMSCGGGGGGGGGDSTGSDSRTIMEARNWKTLLTDGSLFAGDDSDHPPRPSHQKTGLENIARFTYLTRIGYGVYAKLLTTHLPSEQTPRIAPVGLAYLAVHDENYVIWQSLFHCDGLHASPAGTFLQGCIIYYTLFGKMPNKNVVVRENMSTLWTRARMMQHAWDPPNEFPDIGMATYLYRMAERIMVEGYIPTSYLNYTTE